MIDILVIHGPNLNLLGKREPKIYGSMTLSKINLMLGDTATKLNVKLQIFQSNSESYIIEQIQETLENNIKGIIINPAAFTHTSIAIADAILAVNIPTVEVHLSNIFKREKFRHNSYIAPVAQGQICGFGHYGYIMAMHALVNFLTEQKK